MKILVCGDSFAITDNRYPGLHWSEKILDHSADFEINNLAAGGASNAMIAMQLLQGLKFNPDFVIFSFTTEGRYEFDLDTQAQIKDLTVLELADFQKRRWITNCFTETLPRALQQTAEKYYVEAASDSFEWLKNYMFIAFCLQTVATHNIRFAYTLGGFEYQRDWQQKLRSLFVDNMIAPHTANELAVNLWYHSNNTSDPAFHAGDYRVQSLFANECIARINGSYK
jgi:hypothetical protein